MSRRQTYKKSRLSETRNPNRRISPIIFPPVEENLGTIPMDTSEYSPEELRQIEMEIREIERREMERERMQRMEMQRREMQRREMEMQRREMQRREMEREIQRRILEEQSRKEFLVEPMDTDEDLVSDDEEEEKLPREYITSMKPNRDLFRETLKGEKELLEKSKILSLNRTKIEELAKSAREEWFLQGGYNENDIDKIEREIEKVRNADIENAREDFKNEEISIEELLLKERAQYRYLYPDKVNLKKCRCTNEAIITLSGMAAENKNTYRLIEIEDFTDTKRPIIYLKHQNFVIFDKVCHYWDGTVKTYLPCPKVEIPKVGIPKAETAEIKK